MLGIGLGGFVDGWNKQAENQRLAKREKLYEQASQREQSEFDLKTKQRDEIGAINTQAKADFDARVKTGEAQPDQFEEYWTKTALPKLQQTYLTQNNPEMAEKMRAWGEDAETRAGAKLATSAMWKAQNGDIAGALADAQAAGKHKGYIQHGYEILGQDTIVDPKGQLQGYRLNMKGPDGKEFAQDLPIAQVPKLIGTYLNPQAAWESQMAAQQAETERQAGIGDYRTKKEIDAQYSTSGKPTREDAIDALRKRFNGETKVTQDGAVDVPNFDDLSRDEKEKLIAEEIELQSGQPGLGASPSAPAASGSSGRKVLVDTATGQPVAPERPRSQPEPKQPPQISGQARDQRAPESREDRVQFLLSSVEPALKEGVPAERVADELRQNGVPERAWPEALRRALAQRERSAIGIGPQ